MLGSFFSGQKTTKERGKQKTSSWNIIWGILILICRAKSAFSHSLLRKPPKSRKENRENSIAKPTLCKSSKRQETPKQKMRKKTSKISEGQARTQESPQWRCPWALSWEKVVGVLRDTYWYVNPAFYNRSQQTFS